MNNTASSDECDAIFSIPMFSWFSKWIALICKRSYRVGAAATAARTGNSRRCHCSTCLLYAVAATQPKQWKHFALLTSLQNQDAYFWAPLTCTYILNIQHYLAVSSSVHYRVCANFFIVFVFLPFGIFMFAFLCVAGFVDVSDLLVQLCARIKVLPAK